MRCKECSGQADVGIGPYGVFFSEKTPPTIVGGVFMIQLLGGVDRDLLAVLAQALETDNTVSLGKEGIVGADAHVLAGRQ